MSGLDNVVLVLYQTQDVVNIGGVVRVMSNFGLRHLRLVQPATFDPYRIEGIAHHTMPLIQNIELVDSVEAATTDCQLVLATTARQRGTNFTYLEPRQAAPFVLKTATNPANKVAILFGREDDGLPNTIVATTHACITIPTHPSNHSLNLAQAALVVAYELWLSDQGLAGAPEATQTTSPKNSREPASLEALTAALIEDADMANGVEREHLFKTLEALLWALYPRTADQRMVFSMARLRAIFLRAVPRREESRLLAHLFEHLTQVVKRTKN